MKKIFVYGVPFGGLFGIRQLRKQWPESIIYVIAPKTDIGYYSNTYDRFYEATTKEQIEEVTHKAYQDIGEGEVDAFIFSNRMLEYIIDGNEKIFNLLHFENPFSVFKTIVDKNEADKLCRKLGINRPKEYKIDKESHIDGIVYPIVVKPLEKQKTKNASKCKWINNEEELVSYIKEIVSAGSSIKNFVFQQAVSGDNRYEYGYGGYFVNGHPVIEICFHQFRQRPQGLCCYAREMTDTNLIQEIKKTAVPFIKELNYNGFIQFDIKQDMSSGTLFVLDINPRPWGSSDMLRVKLGDTTVFQPSPTNNFVAWKKLPADFLVSSKTNNNIPHQICKTITGNSGFKTIYALYDRKDIRPFMAYLKNSTVYLLMDLKHQLHI